MSMELKRVKQILEGALHLILMNTVFKYFRF
jgi:hypothetical protein